MINAELERPPEAGRRYLSRREVALLFEVSAHTIYRWTREGRLPFVLTPGGRRRYPRGEVEHVAAGWLRVRGGRRALRARGLLHDGNERTG